MQPEGRRFESDQVHQLARNRRAYSSVWLERTPDKREVGGSNPPRPTRLEWHERRVFRRKARQRRRPGRPEVETGIRSGSEWPTSVGAH